MSLSLASYLVLLNLAWISCLSQVVYKSQGLVLKQKEQIDTCVAQRKKCLTEATSNEKVDACFSEKMTEVH